MTAKRREEDSDVPSVSSPIEVDVAVVCHSETAGRRQAMRLLIWNVNGFLPTFRNIALEHGSLAEFFAHHNADVICFQETKVQEDKIGRDYACVDGYESFWACSQTKKGYSGVATWVSKQFSPVNASIDFSATDPARREGRMVMTDLKAFVLINVYVPNAGDTPDRPRLHDKLAFFSRLRAQLDALKEAERSVLVVGDFNVAPTSNDLHRSFSLEEVYCREEISALKSILRDHADIWRTLHPTDCDTFTVFNEKKSYREINKGLRIDYALASADLMEKVISCEVIKTPRKWSDHTALLLELADIPSIPAHRPCLLSSAVRFKQQQTLLSMFSQQKRKTESGEESSSRPKRKADNTDTV